MERSNLSLTRVCTHTVLIILSKTQMNPTKTFIHECIPDNGGGICAGIRGGIPMARTFGIILPGGIICRGPREGGGPLNMSGSGRAGGPNIRGNIIGRITWKDGLSRPGPGRGGGGPVDGGGTPKSNTTKFSEYIPV